ncbi:hypothetical protein ACFFNY_34040 [Paenibacillus hodogayensis]|uniref:Secreted protein n=1 Tax=Paenibacillus hodogayensis TaxID=279208 RepID=A0ABV5W7R5_9BACL
MGIAIGFIVLIGCCLLFPAFCSERFVLRMKARVSACMAFFIQRTAYWTNGPVLAQTTGRLRYPKRSNHGVQCLLLVRNKSLMLLIELHRLKEPDLFSSRAVPRTGCQRRGGFLWVYGRERGSGLRGVGGRMQTP